MKAAIVLVLALVAVSQARHATSSNILNEMQEAIPNMKCAVEAMKNYIEEECASASDLTCYRQGKAAVNEIAKKCFANEIKEHVQSGAQDRDLGDAMKYLGCLTSTSWGLLTGQSNNPLALINCANSA